MTVAGIHANTGADKWWPGELPKNWRIVRAKWTLSQVKGGVWGEDAQGDEWDIPCVRIADFDRLRAEVGSEIPTTRQVEPGLRNGRLLSRGDLVIEKSGGGDNQPVGFVALYVGDQPAVCSNFTTRGQVRQGYDPSFLRYVHMALYSARRNVQHIRQTSGIQNLDVSAYLNELVPRPPLEEQCRIAAFLDHETARIDELVHEQERLQALLAEKRDEVIGRAVREGVDGHEAYEIDDVFIRSAPRSWQVSPLRRFLKHISPRPVGEAWRDYTLLSLTRQGIIKRDIDSGFGKFPAEFNGYQRVQPGQVVFCLFDMDETPRTVGYSDQRGMITSAYAVFEPTEYGDGEFISYYFQYVDTYKGLRPFYSGLRKTIRPNNFLGIRVAMPDRSEQRRIARFLKVELSRLDSLADTVQRGIDLLLERRAALVTAAVTGQLDLRDWTPPAPEAVVEVA